jgi:hypothetical protein
VSDRIEGDGGLGPNGSTGVAGPRPLGAPPPGQRRPLGTVLASVMDGTRTLLRKQVELAKVEMTEALSVRAKGAGLMTAAGVIGLFAVGFTAAAAAAALDLVLPTWAALLIVGLVFVAIAGGLALGGRHAMKTAPSAADQTMETLKEDARWAKQQIAR